MKEKDFIIKKITFNLQSFDILTLTAIYNAVSNLSDKKSKHLFDMTIFDHPNSIK